MNYPIFLLVLLFVCPLGLFAQRIPVQDGYRWGYIDTAGNTIIPFRYRSAYPFSEGLAKVRRLGEYGYIDTLGQTVIEEKYDYASDFKNGRAIVRRNGLNCLVDKNGNELFHFSGIEPVLHHGYISYQSEKTNYFDVRILSCSGKELLEKGEYVYQMPIEDYPFFVVYNKLHQAFLKDTSGSVKIALGQLSPDYLLCGKSLVYLSKCEKRTAASCLDSVLFIGVDGRLLKSIQAKSGYRFTLHSVSFREYYSVIESSLSNENDKTVYVFNENGEVVKSYNPAVESYFYITSNRFIYGKGNQYELRGENDEIITQHITAFDYKPAFKECTPKLLVRLANETQGILSMDGKLDTLPSTYQFLYYNNETKLAEFKSEKNGMLKSYDPLKKMVYGEYMRPYFFSPDLNVLIDDTVHYLTKTGNRIFQSENPWFGSVTEAKGWYFLYPNPYDNVGYRLQDFHVSDTLYSGKQNGTAYQLLVDTVVKRDGDGNPFRVVVLQNPSTIFWRLDSIQRICMEMQTIDKKWKNFGRYYTYKLNNITLKPQASLMFSFPAFQGNYQTKMRLYIEQPTGTKNKKTKLYSNVFNVAVNRDFLYKKND